MFCVYRYLFEVEIENHSEGEGEDEGVIMFKKEEMLEYSDGGWRKTRRCGDCPLYHIHHQLHHKDESERSFTVDIDLVYSAVILSWF